MSGDNGQDTRKIIEDRNWKAMAELIQQFQKDTRELSTLVQRTLKGEAAVTTRMDALEKGLNDIRILLIKQGLYGD